MERRRVLSIIAAAGTLSIAGCSGNDENGGQPEDTDTSSDKDSESSTTTREPEFEIVSIEIPEEVEINEGWNWTMTVENAGSTAGTFRTPVSASIEGGEYSRVGEVELDIPPGETATYESGTSSIPYLTQFTYRFDALGVERQVTIITRVLAFGERYQNPERIVTVANKIDLQRAYTYEGFDGSERTKEASDGMQWAFVQFRATNNSGTPGSVPRNTDIGLIADNRQYDSTYISKEAGKYEGGEIQAGITRSGWIAYEIPQGLTVDDLAVVYNGGNFDGDWAVRWGSG